MQIWAKIPDKAKPFIRSYTALVLALVFLITGSQRCRWWAICLIAGHPD